MYKGERKKLLRKLSLSCYIEAEIRWYYEEIHEGMGKYEEIHEEIRAEMRKYILVTNATTVKKHALD